MLIFCLGSFYSYFYPVKFKEQIIACTQDTQISPALVASIINVESGYDSQAKSSKGALGLMQIMPQTAQWICNKKGIAFDEIDLLSPDDNIFLGCLYLKMLLTDFESQDVAICAYNAGPSRIRSWLADSDLSSDGKTLTKIPYKETKNYLSKVKKNMRYYQNKYNSNKFDQTARI